METPQQKQWREAPDNWVWGLFYYNREDKRIFPPKRIAWMGWTVNFAHPPSFFALIIILAMAGIVLYAVS